MHVIEQLLCSPYHEHRLCGGLLLVDKYKKATKDKSAQQAIYNFYLQHHLCFNNWDLVDLTSPQIVGEHLYNNPQELKQILHLAQHGTLWQQRISMVANWGIIKHKQYDTTLLIAILLLHHPHDLIQKAVGWMLREVGKKNFDVEYRFLTDGSRYKTMPRTALRYAIEKFEPSMRQAFLKGDIQ